jgi:hypothetical protein
MPKERNKITIKPTFGIVKQPSKVISLQLTIAKNMDTNGTNFIYSKTKLI